MPNRSLSASVARMSQSIASTAAAPAYTDDQLIGRYVASGDEAAFATLVARHGPMVRAVCRRVAGDHHLADDAFQAAFLVLARRAAAVNPRGAVRGWLYGVAVRTAREARAMAARRRRREVAVPCVPDRASEERSPPDADELRALDEEIARLAEPLRAAVVLCELDGESRKVAAARLGVPEGTLSSRLAKARRILAARLRNRGVVGPLCGLTAAVQVSPLSASLVEATARMVGTTPVPAAIAALTREVFRTMLLGKLKLIAVATAAVLASACSLVALAPSAQDDSPPVAKSEPAVVPPLPNPRIAARPSPTTAPDRVVPDRLISRFEDHDATITDVAFSPDSKLIASRGEGESIRVWEADTRKEKYTIKPTAKRGPLAFTADGKRLVVYDGGKLVIYAAASGKQESVVDVEPGGDLSSVTMSRDGTRLAAAEKGKVHIWDTAQGGKPLFTNDTAWTGQYREGNAWFEFALSHDGTRFASTLKGGSGLPINEVKLWEAATGYGRTTITNRGSLDGRVTPLLSPDGKLVVVRPPMAWGVSVYDSFTSREVSEDVLPSGVMYPCDFGSDGKTFVAARGEQTVMTTLPKQVVVINLATKSVVLSFDVKEMHGCWKFLVSPDGKRLATVQGKLLKVWSLEGRDPKPVPVQPPAVRQTVVPSTSRDDVSIDGRVVRVKMPRQDVTLYYVESKGGMAVELRSAGMSFSGSKFYVGDGTVALEMKDDAGHGILLQGQTKLRQGHTFSTGATIKVVPGYKQAADLKAGDVYVILPGVVFELPTK